MNISESFIRRPIATSLLMLAIALFGVIAYRALPVSDLPTVDYPTLTVSASLPGANPETMASSVATPMERQFTTIAGLDSMISSSSQGSTDVTLQFTLDRDIDGATVDVETAIAAVTPLLPPGMPTPPSFHKVNPGDQPIISLFVTSPTMRLSDLDEYAETMIAQRISMVAGVAQVQVYGSTKYAVRVQVDPNRLAARQIGLNEIDAAIKNWNVNTPTGTLYGDGPPTTFGQPPTDARRRLSAMIVIIATARPCGLKMSPTSSMASKTTRISPASTAPILTAEMDPRHQLAIMRQPGSNTIEVVDRVKTLLPCFRR